MVLILNLCLSCPCHAVLWRTCGKAQWSSRAVQLCADLALWLEGREDHYFQDLVSEVTIYTGAQADARISHFVSLSSFISLPLHLSFTFTLFSIVLL